MGDEGVEEPTIRQTGVIPVVTYMPAWAWRCGECGWLGIGLTSEREALGEASDHYWDEHGVALCKPIIDDEGDRLRLISHPGHRWNPVSGTDAVEECERCHDTIGK